jgi:hypothetical protein
MTHRDVFLAAAERILDGRNDLACIATKRAVEYANGTWLMWIHCHDLFYDLFAPTPEPGVPAPLAWWEQGDKESRVVALLLAAEISKTYY